MVNQEVAIGNQEVSMVNVDGKEKEKGDNIQKGEYMSFLSERSWSIVGQF